MLFKLYHKKNRKIKIERKSDIINLEEKKEEVDYGKSISSCYGAIRNSGNSW